MKGWVNVLNKIMWTYKCILCAHTQRKNGIMNLWSFFSPWSAQMQYDCIRNCRNSWCVYLYKYDIIDEVCLTVIKNCQCAYINTARLSEWVTLQSGYLMQNSIIYLYSFTGTHTWQLSMFIQINTRRGIWMSIGVKRKYWRSGLVNVQN